MEDTFGMIYSVRKKERKTNTYMGVRGSERTSNTLENLTLRKVGGKKKKKASFHLQVGYFILAKIYHTFITLQNLTSHFYNSAHLLFFFLCFFHLFSCILCLPERWDILSHLALVL